MTTKTSNQLGGFNPILTVRLDTYKHIQDPVTKEIYKERTSEGGVTLDRMQEVMGHVYDESRYNKDGSRIFIPGIIAE